MGGGFYLQFLPSSCRISSLVWMVQGILDSYKKWAGGWEEFRRSESVISPSSALEILPRKMWPVQLGLFFFFLMGSVCS